MDAFERAVRQNVSIAGVIRTLGRAIVGSNYRYVKREVERRKLDTTHWTGKAHGRSRRSTDTPLKAVLVANSTYARGPLKRRLLKAGLLKHVCALCGINTWRGKPLTLRLDHINGHNNDNRLCNLRLLCPNCDSQLPTYCGRNKSR